jgi:hypothetical protein
MRSKLHSVCFMFILLGSFCGVSAQSLEPRFTINGSSTSFSTASCNSLVISASGPFSCIGHNSVHWELFLDDQLIDQDLNEYYGLFGPIDDYATFAVPPKPGNYKIRKTLKFGADYESQVIRVTLLQACTPAEKGNLLHVLGVTASTFPSASNLWHTIRFDTAFAWQDFRDAEGPAGERGQFVDVDSAVIGKELHVVGVTNDGKLWHAIRRSGGWEVFRDVRAAVGGPSEGDGWFTRVSVAAVGGVLHVAAIDRDHRLWHTIRFANSWQPFFGQIIHVAGMPSDGDAQFVDVGITGVGGALHVAAVNASGNLHHTIRFANSWQPFFGDVRYSAQPPFVTDAFKTVAAGEVDGELHLCMTTTGGDLYHTIRFPGIFQYLGNVKFPTQTPASRHFSDVSCRQSGGELHVVAVTDTGELWHTVRHRTSWDRFGNVELANAGERGDFTAVSVVGTFVP